jgi:O-antigen/teichoic acid export membrane protein
VNLWRALWGWAKGLLQQPLFANAGYLLGIEALNSLAGFAFWGLAARLYAPQEVGLATAVLSAVSLISGIAGMGVGVGLVRYLPETHAPTRLLNTTLTFCALMGILAGSGYLLGISRCSPTLAPLQHSALYAAGFVSYVALSTLGTALKMAYVAHRRAEYSLAYAGLVNAGRLGLVGLLAGLGAAGLVTATGAAVLLAGAVGLWGFMPRLRPGYWPRPALSWADMQATVPYSIGNHVGGLLAQSTQTVMPLIVLETLGQEANAHAYMALLLGGVLASPGAALAGSAFAEGAHVPRELDSILGRAATLGLAITVPGSLLIALAAPWVLRLFGADYALEGASLLRWLCLAAPLAVIKSIYFSMLRVNKQVGRLIVSSVVFAVATLGLGAVLMPTLGIAACGIGLLGGNGLVSALAVGQVISGERVRSFARSA